MKHEKSCGAIIYNPKPNEEGLNLLLLRHRAKGHWSFPKGHVEGSETEIETALREVKEETGLDILLRDGFRECVEYYPKPGVKKQVVYFLGYLDHEQELHRQEEEVSELGWVPLEKAHDIVTFKNDKNLIAKATKYLDTYTAVPPEK